MFQFSIDKLYPEAKRSEIYGQKYLVKDGNNNIPINRKRYLKCVDCNKEIFSSVEKILIGQNPCACGRNYYKTPERKLEKVREVAKEKNVSFVFLPELKSYDTRFIIECRECSFEWETYYSYFAGSHKGCPMCGGSFNYSDEEYIRRLNIIGDKKNFSFLEKTSSEKLTNKSRVILKCSQCEHIWESSLTNILSGKYSCPACSRRGFNPKRKSLLYLLKINDSNECLAYKFGISNSIEKRLQNIRTEATGLEITVSATWLYEDGGVAANHEKELKKFFGKYLTKSQLSDGYTETISPEEVLEFFNMQMEQHIMCHGGVEPGGGDTDVPN